MKRTLLAALVAILASPGPAAAADAPARPLELNLTAAAYGGAFDGLGVRRESGSMAVVEVAARPELSGEGWRLEVPLRVAHRETFGADLSELSGAIDVAPWYEATRKVRLGLTGGVFGASRPDWPDLYQRDPVTGANAPTDRYGYLAWRVGGQLYARPARHQHVRARYRFVSYDYAGEPAFDELDPMHLTPRDRGEHRLDGSWRYREDTWAIGVEGEASFAEYATLLARSRRSGSTSSASPKQELTNLEPAVELELERMEGRLRVSLRYGLELQDDPYQGYYSYTGHHPRLQVKVAATERLSLQAAVEGWYRTYGPDGSTRLEGTDTRRTDARTRVRGEVAHQLRGGLSLRAEASWVTRTTNYRDYVPPPAGTSAYDIDFDYTNLSVLAGLEYRL